MDLAKIKTVHPDKVVRVLQVFEMMSLVAKNPDDFNPEIHCEEGSEQFELLSFWFIKETKTFHYKLFLVFCMNEIGDNLHCIIQGYEMLIEKHFNPDMQFLKTDLKTYYKSISNN
jgi:hypothetical protein